MVVSIMMLKWAISTCFFKSNLDRCPSPHVVYVLMSMYRRVLPEHYKSLEKTIKFISKQKQPFVRLVLTKAEALDMFKHNQFKQEIISTKVPDGATCTAYRCGPLIDLCRYVWFIMMHCLYHHRTIL
jgi:threonyl-tRNA synthetase